ncbi:MAG: arylesterase [Novosphingobium sp.]
MKLYGFAVLAALLLASCGKGNEPTPAPTAAAAPEMPVMGPERRILALGDSLFAGYGVKPAESYPAKLETALRAHGVNARIANAGVSGDTSADGLTRLAFTLNSQPQAPDLVIISLGGNDMLRGLAPEQTKVNLDAIITELTQRKIPVVLMGLLAPPNLGADYRGKFDAIYPALAEKHHVSLVPFFLKAVFDKPDLIQQDHIHPTAHGIDEIVAATTYAVEGELTPRAN